MECTGNPEFHFAVLFHGAQQHDEQSSDVPPAPWSQVSTPACHNVCHTLLLVQVPSKLLTPTLREEVMWVRKNGAEVHPLGAVSRVPPLATLCAYTCNSVLIILRVNMSCVLLNELVTRSIFTWRISEKNASDSKRKHQSYFGGKLLEVLNNMSQLASSLCLPCREDMMGLGFYTSCESNYTTDCLLCFCGILLGIFFFFTGNSNELCWSKGVWYSRLSP